MRLPVWSSPLERSRDRLRVPRAGQCVAPGCRRRFFRRREQYDGPRRGAVHGRLARGDVGHQGGRRRREPHRGWAGSGVRVAPRRVDSAWAGSPRRGPRRAFRRHRLAVQRRRASRGGVGRGFRDCVSIGPRLRAVAPDGRRLPGELCDSSVHIRRRRDSRGWRHGYRLRPRVRRGVPVERERRSLDAGWGTRQKG